MILDPFSHSSCLQLVFLALLDHGLGHQPVPQNRVIVGIVPLLGDFAHKDILALKAQIFRQDTKVCFEALVGNDLA